MKTQTPPLPSIPRALLLVSLAFSGVSLFAQTGTAHPASCKADKSAPSDADIAFARDDFKKSRDLFAASVAKNPTDSRSRYFEIASMLSQGKHDDAVKEADAWTAESEKNPYAILSQGIVRNAEGDWPEYYALTLKAMKIDPCLPYGYENLAEFESVSGYHATAHRNLTLAHQLAPNDQEIRLEWIHTLPETERIAESQKYLQDSPAVNDKNRKTLVANYDKSIVRTENRCNLISAKIPVHIPLAPVYDGLTIKAWGLEIAFNGRKRVLQIDTGASGFTLTQSVYAGLGLVAVDKRRLGGFGDEGSTGSAIKKAESVRIGGLEFHNCEVDVLDRTGVLGGSNMGMGQARLDKIDGLVGMDIFDRYLVTIDYIKHELRLDSLPLPGTGATGTPELDALGGRTDPDWMQVDRVVAPSMQSWTKIYRRGHMLIMPTRIGNGKDQGRNRLFIVDTGADSNIIDVKVAKEITHTNENTLVTMGGVSGKVDKVFETGRFTIDFAGLRLPVTSMDSIDLDKFDGVTGFLGYPTLEQLVMHIDYRDNLVLFDAPTGKHL